MKQQADHVRSKHQFIEGGAGVSFPRTLYVYLLKVEHYQKLSPKFYGPYTILKRVGHVTYQLALPSHSKIHPIFHVSCLNKVIGSKCQTQTSLPKLDE